MLLFLSGFPLAEFVHEEGDMNADQQVHLTTLSYPLIFM